MIMTRILNFFNILPWRWRVEYEEWYVRWGEMTIGYCATYRCEWYRDGAWSDTPYITDVKFALPRLPPSLLEFYARTSGITLIRCPPHGVIKRAAKNFKKVENRGLQIGTDLLDIGQRKHGEPR